MTTALLRRRPDPDDQPPPVLDAPGCWSCPHWFTSTGFVGRCVFEAERNGWTTCAGYACHHHPEVRT